MATLRADYRRLQAIGHDLRSPSRIVAHYELERELADRLRNSTKAERNTLYGELYPELFARITDHPQHTAAHDSNSPRLIGQIKILAPYLSPASVFVEIGCGDAALSVAIAPLTGKCIGVDVTDTLLPIQKPINFNFMKTDGTSLDLISSSVDLVYSNQLMEHLHPDDAKDQLMEVRRVLKKGGIYICITPNRVTGPHDISKYFDEVATGFHLREYDYASLKALFVDSGFRRFRAMVVIRGRRVNIPYFIMRTAETGLSSLPNGIRSRVIHNRMVRLLLGVNAIATA